MTPLDRTSEDIRESTTKAYSLAESMGLNPSNVSQTYRPVETNKSIATGQIDVVIDDFRKLQPFVNEFLLKGYNVTFIPFIEKSKGLTIDAYISKHRKAFEANPKRIIIKLTDCSTRTDDLVLKENLELIATQGSVQGTKSVEEQKLHSLSEGILALMGGKDER